MTRFHTIESNRLYSSTELADSRAHFEQSAFEGVKTIAIAGSFGRLEASRTSDADFIVVLEDDASEDLAKNALVEIQKFFQDKGIDAPNPQGVFAKPRKLVELVPPTADGGVGQPDEEFDVLGKRMLLLLESTWLWNQEGFDEVVDRIFEHYARYVLLDTSKEHVYLLNDLIRYFRYICVNYQSSFGSENEKWAIRNMKLRHSRLLMYFGMLALIGNASRYRDEQAISALRDNLAKTPLERVEFVYAEAGDFSYPRFAGLYNNFLTTISDPHLRGELNAIEYERRYEDPIFSQLKANSDAFQAELTRFVFARRSFWSDRFFDYLLF